MASSDSASYQRSSSQSSSTSGSRQQRQTREDDPESKVLTSRHVSSASLRNEPQERPSTPPANMSDDQSLTSFPSLSPSLEASPADTRREGLDDGVTPKSSKRLPRANSRKGAQQSGSPAAKAPRPLPTSLNSLFALDPRATDRSTLFEDAQKGARRVPGALHYQTNAQIEHLMRGVGPVSLIKQLAQDLAQRDVQVTQLQRRAEERERLLKKMLRECEVSNLDIERRLRQLRLDPKDTESRTRADSTASQWSEIDTKPEDAIDERMEEALRDTLGIDAALGSERYGASGPRIASASDGTVDATGRTSVDDEDAVLVSSDNRQQKMQSGTSRGWKDYFRNGVGREPHKTAPRPAIKQSDTVIRRDSRVSSTSKPSTMHKGLSSDVFKPPPQSPPDSRRPSANGSAAIDATRNAASVSNDGRKSGSSVANWALKLVGANTQSSDQSDGELRQNASLSDDQDMTPKRRPMARVKSGAEVATTATTASARPPALSSAGQNGQPKKPTSDGLRHGGTSRAAVHSPRGSISSERNLNLGPVEMDTILPDDVRPPTLASHDNAGGDDTDFLTDRFGFIYDQRRRKRQSDAAAALQRQHRGSRVETLENHRLSIASMQSGDEDAISISSQNSAQPPLGSSPYKATFGGQAVQTKKWQDYLKVSSLSSELLSHTPSVEPSADEEDLEREAESQVQTQLLVSKRGTMPHATSNPAPAPSRVTSEHAELAMPTTSGETSPVAAPEPQPDPVKSLLDQLTEVHDSLQKDKSNKWNDFLRKVRAERERDTDNVKSSSNTSGIRHGRPKSISLPEANFLEGEVIGVAGLGNKGKVGRAKWSEFRQLVLSGIPVAYRAKIWSECSGAASMRVPGYYDDLVRSNRSDASGADQIIVQQIQADITRTLTDNIFFRRGTGVGKLEEVLLAYARRNPAIGYCQGMNLITANLLLILPTAEDAFWLLTSLVEEILPDGYYDHSLLASRADQVVLKHYVSTLLPALSNHLDTLHVELEAATFHWFLSLFTACLSAEALFRVWDVLFCANDGPSGGGSTFLFQVALALLKLNEKELLRCESPAEIYAYMGGRMTNHAISIDGLIKASESLKKWVRRDEVEQRRSEEVEREREIVRTREAIRSARPGPGKSERHERGDSVASRGGRAATDGQEGGVAQELDGNEDTLDNDDDDDELQIRTPMPIEEEVAWRG
ncbi:MAG: hypothetical protein M1828_003909 [Chrysothrix sp. TS-e1954]|nr:MAG: hypothetical protein M1828_003909 [Chrysothrix sp. TS-e1954]